MSKQPSKLASTKKSEHTLSRATKLAGTQSSMAPFGQATLSEIVKSPKTEKKSPFEVTSNEIP
jgi:hypothetical protein